MQTEDWDLIDGPKPDSERLVPDDGPRPDPQPVAAAESDTEDLVGPKQHRTHRSAAPAEPQSSAEPPLAGPVTDVERENKGPWTWNVFSWRPFGPSSPTPLPPTASAPPAPKPRPPSEPWLLSRLDARMTGIVTAGLNPFAQVHRPDADVASILRVDCNDGEKQATLVVSSFADFDRQLREIFPEFFGGPSAKDAAAHWSRLTGNSLAEAAPSAAGDSGGDSAGEDSHGGARGDGASGASPPADPNEPFRIAFSTGSAAERVGSPPAFVEAVFGLGARAAAAVARLRGAADASPRNDASPRHHAGASEATLYRERFEPVECDEDLAALVARAVKDENGVALVRMSARRASALVAEAKRAAAELDRAAARLRHEQMLSELAAAVDRRARARAAALASTPEERRAAARDARRRQRRALTLVAAYVALMAVLIAAATSGLLGARGGHSKLGPGPLEDASLSSTAVAERRAWGRVWDGYMATGVSKLPPGLRTTSSAAPGPGKGPPFPQRNAPSALAARQSAGHAPLVVAVKVLHVEGPVVALAAPGGRSSHAPPAASPSCARATEAFRRVDELTIEAEGLRQALASVERRLASQASIIASLRELRDRGDRLAADRGARLEACEKRAVADAVDATIVDRTAVDSIGPDDLVGPKSPPPGAPREVHGPDDLVGPKPRRARAFGGARARAAAAAARAAVAARTQAARAARALPPPNAPPVSTRSDARAGGRSVRKGSPSPAWDRPLPHAPSAAGAPREAPSAALTVRGGFAMEGVFDARAGEWWLSPGEWIEALGGAPPGWVQVGMRGRIDGSSSLVGRIYAAGGAHARAASLGPKPLEGCSAFRLVREVPPRDPDDPAPWKLRWDAEPSPRRVVHDERWIGEYECFGVPTRAVVHVHDVDRLASQTFAIAAELQFEAREASDPASDPSPTPSKAAESEAAESEPRNAREAMRTGRRAPTCRAGGGTPSAEDRVRDAETVARHHEAMRESARRQVRGEQAKARRRARARVAADGEAEAPRPEQGPHPNPQKPRPGKETPRGGPRSAGGGGAPNRGARGGGRASGKNKTRGPRRGKRGKDRCAWSDAMDMVRQFARGSHAADRGSHAGRCAWRRAVDVVEQFKRIAAPYKETLEDAANKSLDRVRSFERVVRAKIHEATRPDEA
jgi:hypothetical protein